MARRRPFKSTKKLVFLAGEGLSEQSYGRWLYGLARAYAVPVAIRAEGLEGGDPLELVEAAISKVANAERTGRRYRVRGLLFDNDLFGRNPGRDAQALKKAQQHGFHLIRQRPVHEAFLLRHFPSQQTRRPSDGTVAVTLLKKKKVWPEYSKGMGATGYERRLTLDHLNRARSVEPELDAFLDLMGWR